MREKERERKREREREREREGDAQGQGKDLYIYIFYLFPWRKKVSPAEWKNVRNKNKKIIHEPEFMYNIYFTQK